MIRPRRRWLGSAGLIAAGAVLILGNAATAMSDDFSGLNSYDVKHAGLFDVAEMGTGETVTSVQDGISTDDAVAIAGEFIAIDTTAVRAYSATASLYFGQAPQPVIVIVTPGGTIPVDGPVGSVYADKPLSARITGVILDAKTGAFLGGFMHNGTEP